MQKLIFVGLFILVAGSAEAGLSTGPRGQTAVTEAHAEVQLSPRRHKPVTFEKQLERSFKKAFRF